jgi:hypothetical protein
LKRYLSIDIFIADLPAMQVALARLDELGIDRIYCGGRPRRVWPSSQ